MPRKNIAKLIPVKRNVINKKTGSTNEITYYIDPNKDKHKERQPGKKDDTTTPDNKAPNDNTKKEPLQVKPKGNDPFNGVNDFEDFGKKGIDPTAARQFFCNM